MGLPPGRPVSSVEQRDVEDAVPCDTDELTT